MCWTNYEPTVMPILFYKEWQRYGQSSCWWWHFTSGFQFISSKTNRVELETLNTIIRRVSKTRNHFSPCHLRWVGDKPTRRQAYKPGVLTLSYPTSMEKCPNPNKEIDGSIPSCEIFSLLNGKTKSLSTHRKVDNKLHRTPRSSSSRVKPTCSNPHPIARHYISLSSSLISRAEECDISLSPQTPIQCCGPVSVVRRLIWTFALFSILFRQVWLSASWPFGDGDTKWFS